MSIVNARFVADGLPEAALTAISSVPTIHALFRWN
jgi:hypothetical protein